MKTITFDEAVYKLVPVADTQEWRANIDEIGYSHINVISAVLAAVPDNLPGVVEHSGKPFGYTAGAGNQKWPHSLYPTQSAYIDTPLFTHPSPIANPLAIVQATLDAAAMLPEGRSAGRNKGFELWLEVRRIGRAIRAIDPQTILDGMEK